jgi:L-iditol 2-dehydrogenase
MGGVPIAMMRQLTCPATGVLEVATVPVPRLEPGDLLVQLAYCGICGTDLMKVYAADVPKPVQLGHELVATIVAAGADVPWLPHLAVGRRIAAAHHVPDYSSHYTRRGSAPMDAQFKASNIDPGGFADLIRIPALHVRHTVVPVPEGMPALRAVFMEPLACCLRTLDRIDVVEGDTALVIGAGAVGLLFVPLFCDRSVRVLAADVRRSRLAVAAEWGAAQGFVVGEDEVAEGARAATNGRGADVVILTVLNEATLNLAMAAVRDGGAIVLFGVKPGARLPFDFWQLWRREINLVSSYSATPDLLPRAMAILQRAAYPLETTVSHVLPLDEAPEGFRLSYEGQASKVVISRERQ